MNYLLKSPLMAAVSALLLAAPLLASAVQAAEEVEQPNPLRFYQGDNSSFLQASVGLDLAYFSMDDAWYGNDRAVIGSDIDNWWESLVRLGLEGSYTLPNSQTFYARVDAVQANTFGGIDVGGTNDVHGDVSSLRLDKAYAGWRSGQLFSSLGQDFLDIALGRQLYTVGDGFLFACQGQGGGKRAAWYLGGRRSTDFSTIIRMHSGPWSGDLFYFEEDRMNDFEKEYFGDQNTRAGGVTMEYAFSESAHLGGSLFALDSDNLNRDGMQVYDLRGDIKPFARLGGAEILRPLRFAGEYAHEDKDNDQENGNGWYAAVSYQFAEVPWQPELTYRYASFDQHYDPLFYGGNDWGTWYQGEIVGEYDDLANSNIDAHMLRLKVQPLESLTIHLLYFNFTVHQPEALLQFGSATESVTSDDYADEWDLIFDWAATDHLTLSLVGAYAKPDDAAEQHYGGSDDWTAMMLYGSLKF